MIVGCVALGCATTPGTAGTRLGPGQIPSTAVGVVRVVPQLVVDDVDKAAQFYSTAFGAQGDPLTIGDSPISLVAEDLAGGRKTPNTLAVTVASLDIYVPVADEAFRRAHNAGARPTFLVEHRFWGDRYGQVADRSGHKWGLASRMETLSPAELAARSKQAFAATQKSKVAFEPPPQPPAPVPAEHHNIVIHLVVPDIQTAAAYYEKTFGARLLFKHPAPDGTFIHARMMFGNTMVLLDRELPPMKLLSPKSAGGTSMVLLVDAKNKPAGEREFADPFGHHWHIDAR